MPQSHSGRSDADFNSISPMRAAAALHLWPMCRKGWNEHISAVLNLSGMNQTGSCYMGRTILTVFVAAALAATSVSSSFAQASGGAGAGGAGAGGTGAGAGGAGAGAPGPGTPAASGSGTTGANQGMKAGQQPTGKMSKSSNQKMKDKR